MFDTQEQRKRFFWICFVIAMLVVVAGLVFFFLRYKALAEKALLVSLLSLLKVSLMWLVLDLSVLCSTLWPNQFNYDYIPRISLGKFRLERQQSLPDDPEGLRFCSNGFLLILLNITIFLLNFSQLIIDSLVGKFLFAFGIAGIVGSMVLLCLSYHHIQKHYQGL